MRMLRKLTGVHLIAHRVRMTHARTRGAREFSAYFGCAVEFGASVDEMLFVRKLGQLPVVDADPYLNRVDGEIVRRSARASRHEPRTDSNAG